MDKHIVDILAKEALKHIDIAEFAKQLAPKLLKEVEHSMLASAKEMEWGDFLYEAIGTQAVSKELSRRIASAFKKDA